jgi:ribosomal protein L21E
MEAHERGEWDALNPPANAHKDAVEAVRRELRDRATVAIERARRDFALNNRILDISTVKVGDRVWSVFRRKYGVVIRVHKRSCRVEFNDARSEKAFGGHLERLSPEDLAKAFAEMVA